MFKSYSFGRSLLIATIVALGIAASWCMLIGWVEQSAEHALRSREPYENIHATITGEPVVVRATNGNTQNTERILSLSGDPLEITSQDLLHLSTLEPPTKTRQYPAAANWQSRIAGINDGGVPATYWYLVHDGNFPGHAYGIAFHASTRSIKGYFGRSGFKDFLPPRDDWFEIDNKNGLYGSLTVYNLGQEPRWTMGKPHFLLLADGKLWRIDLAKKKISELLDCPHAFRLSSVYRILEERPSSAGDNASYSASSITPTDALIRDPDSLTVVNQQTGETRRFSLPPDLRDKILSAALLPNGQLLLSSQEDWRDSDPAIVWLEASGEIVKQQHVRLQSRYHPRSWAWLGWQFALAAPLPLATAVTSLVIGPLSAMEESDAVDFGQGIRLILHHTWPSILAVLGLSIACGVGAYRRQRRFGMPYASAWAAFAFVLGLPGWLAYRFHRTWPVLEDCPSCHQPSPRDRVTCLDCGKPFPPPPLKGIEVFA